jgi:hypothetical protein
LDAGRVSGVCGGEVSAEDTDLVCNPTVSSQWG